MSLGKFRIDKFYSTIESVKLELYIMMVVEVRYLIKQNHSRCEIFRKKPTQIRRKSERINRTNTASNQPDKV